MIRLKQSVLTAFAAIGANRRRPADDAAKNGGAMDRDRCTIGSQIPPRAAGLGCDLTQPTEIVSRRAESDRLDRIHNNLQQMLQREGGGYTLLAKCNVSRFQDIRTSFGQDVGDALLIEVGQRLRTLVHVVIGRLSSDEFAIALPLPDADLSEATIIRIQELLAPRFVLPGATIDGGFLIGYAVGNARDNSIGLLRMADIAMHKAKLLRSPDPIEFDREAAIRIERRVGLTSDLDLAKISDDRHEAAVPRKLGRPNDQSAFLACGAPSAVVVDDDPCVRATVSEKLKYLGWIVTTACSAEEALALPESFPAPRIVITDVDLGAGMDGFEFCPVARRRWPSIDIVVISGRLPCSKQLATLGLHDVFLLKPVHMSALKSAIAGRWADQISGNSIS
jgi:GGDEF domain-containing protein/CheY-like chemotaxis protein